MPIPDDYEYFKKQLLENVNSFVLSDNLHELHRAVLTAEKIFSREDFPLKINLTKRR